MLNPSFEGILKEGDSRYTLVLLVSKRARQIIEGEKLLVDTDSKKPVSIAIEEILAGKITYNNPPIENSTIK